jgi:competence protein ComEA
MFKKYKIHILVLLIMVIGGTFYFINKPNEKIVTTEDILKKEVNNEQKQQEVIIKQVQVDIKGAVNSPGVYTLTENSRVKDVIELAAGLNKYADTSYINLSKKIYDEMVIIINTKKEIIDYKNNVSNIPEVLDKLITNTNNDSLIPKEAISIVNPIENNNSNTTNSSINTSKISINNADSTLLQTLPGIGEMKANDIINYRNNNGGFKQLEDLKKVSGIGEATFAKIKDYITL